MRLRNDKPIACIVISLCAWSSMSSSLPAIDFATPLVAVADPSAELRPETEAQRRARHERVARARAGTVILLHKGGGVIAPENRLSGIQAAFDLGCQAVELDFRRTRDGTIVLFHDSRLERLVDAFGTVEESFYEELALSGFRDRDRWPKEVAAERIPTVRDVLQLLRDRAGLVFLDVKTPGIDVQLLDEFRKANMLDHVVGHGADHSDAFKKAGVPQVTMKGALLEDHDDLRPDEVRKVLARPGNMVFVDDPRATLTLLGVRPTAIRPRPVAPLSPRSLWPLAPLEAVLRGQSHSVPVRQAAARLTISDPNRFLKMAAALVQSPEVEGRRVVARCLGIIASHETEVARDHGRLFLDLLNDKEPIVQGEAAVACAQLTRPGRRWAANESAAKIIAPRLSALCRSAADPVEPSIRRMLAQVRGQFAYALGGLDHGSPEVITALRDAFKYREVGPEKTWLGVDGAMAAWALGRLRLPEAVPLLREALLCEAAEEEPDDEESAKWLVFWDLQAPRFVPEALKRIGNPQARAVPEDVLILPLSKLKRLSPELLGRTAEALVNFTDGDRLKTVAGLFAHESPQVRGEAILACLRESDPAYRALLKDNGVDWALDWWDAQH